MAKLGSTAVVAFFNLIEFNPLAGYKPSKTNKNSETTNFVVALYF